ncbi:MAG: hypothetical protein HC787_10445 [Nostocaceae cyanobacterium CSU_2_110]|nr:hypothetical protein [Nostocaceae cyanobacterium CSU_2_110]
MILANNLSNAPETYTSFNVYVQDQSRFGLFTRNGKSLTAKGVKPICTYQNVFKSTYIFGAFSPYIGDSLLMELPYCNGENFTQYYILIFGFRDVLRSSNFS